MDDRNLFLEYKQLMENTQIQECYRQVISLLKTIQTTLEKDMDSFRFMNRIVENLMDFSYFQLTDDQLKEVGLKIQVVFFHNTCRFEVWTSGYNRAVQKQYYPVLSGLSSTFEACDDPLKNDFIIRKRLDADIVSDSEEEIIRKIKAGIEELYSLLIGVI